MGSSDDDIRIENNSSAVMSPGGFSVSAALNGHLERKRIGNYNLSSNNFFLWNPLIASVIHNE
jgi:hypothetical protein